MSSSSSSCNQANAERRQPGANRVPAEQRTSIEDKTLFPGRGEHFIFPEVLEPVVRLRRRFGHELRPRDRLARAFEERLVANRKIHGQRRLGYPRLRTLIALLIVFHSPVGKEAPRFRNVAPDPENSHPFGGRNRIASSAQ